MKPRAGITYRFDEKLRPYVEAVRYAGLDPVPLLAPGPVSLEGLDALLISGGTDLDPSLYGQTPHPEAEPPDAERDAMELRLVRLSIEADLPLLCICRGFQLLNVALGGDLVQHLPNADQHRQRGVTDAHLVKPVAGSALAEVVGNAPFTVNSRHHQAIQRLADGLAISAQSGDGLIEGLELPGRRFALAVQWHPEDRVPSHDPDTRLFGAFARAAQS